MMAWLADNMGTIVVILVLAAIVVSISAKLMRDKKKGKSSCGGNCAHCALGGCCHSHLGDSDLSAGNLSGNDFRSDSLRSSNFRSGSLRSGKGI